MSGGWGGWGRGEVRLLVTVWQSLGSRADEDNDDDDDKGTGDCHDVDIDLSDNEDDNNDNEMCLILIHLLVHYPLITGLSVDSIHTRPVLWLILQSASSAFLLCYDVCGIFPPGCVLPFLLVLFG